MKSHITFLATALLAAGSALAQTTAQPGTPAQRQPATPATSTTSQGPQKPAVMPATPQQPEAQKVDPAKEKAIRHLMELNGSSKLGDNVTQALALQVKSTMSRSLPADRLQKFMDDFNQRLIAKSPVSEVTNAEVSTYDQHFSLEDLQGIIQFYESPVGQRMAKVLPEVMQQSQKDAADIERTAALSTLREMTGDYPELKTMLPPEEQKPSLGPGAQPQQPEQPPAKPQTPGQQPNPPKPQPQQ